MYWVEICSDGSYVIGDQEFPILAEGIVESESYEGERSGNDWIKFTIPFSLETEHGFFAWEVKAIEYLEHEVTSLLGYQITDFPHHVLLKDEVTFCIQDGWAHPKETKLHLRPPVTKMRLVLKEDTPND